MNGVSGLARAGEWWSYKIPPLLAIAYALFLVSGVDAWTGLGRTAAALVSIVAVAAYGYVINDCFDIESDRLAGKRNRMGGLAVWQRIVIVGLILAIGWTPGFLVEYSVVTSVLLAIDFLLPTIYSMPPIRLKERGVLGVISDASAAHLVPTLFLSSLFLSPPGEASRWNQWFAAAAAVWYSVVGLRGILNHQILDREADLASGVTTMVTGMSQVQALRWTRRVFYVVEMVAFVVFVWMLSEVTWLLVPLFLIAACLELSKRLLGWEETYVVRGEVDRSLRMYLPFANNIFYNLWLPVVLSVEVAIAHGSLVLLPAFHVGLFGRRLLEEYREPRVVLQEAWRRFRVGWLQWRSGWTLASDLSLAPRFTLGGDGSRRIEPVRAAEHAWDVRLVGIPFPLTEGKPYQLRFRMRADRRRPLTLGVCESRSPWRDLGVSDRVWIEPEFASRVLEFVANRSERESSCFLFLGEDETAVEVSDVRVVCLDRPGPFRLMTETGASARATVADDPQTWVRVESIEGAERPWDARLFGPSISAKSGSILRLEVRLRADEVRPVTFGLVEAVAPYRAIGEPVTVCIGPNEHRDRTGDVSRFQGLVGEFAVPSDLPVCLSIWLGGATAAVELGASRWNLAADRVWSIECLEDATATRVLESDPESVGRVEIDRAGARLESVQITTRIGSLERGKMYRFELALRSDDAKRITVGVDEGVAPWRQCGQLVELFVQPEYRRFVFDIVAERDAQDARLSLWVGGDATAMEWGSLNCRPLSEGERSWEIHCDENTQMARLVSDGAAIGRLFLDGVLEAAWDARLVGSLQSVKAGEWLRCRVRLRADESRPIVYGLCGSDAPWEPVGPTHRTSIDAKIREFWTDVLVTEDADQVSPFLAVGESAVSVDVDAFALEAIGPESAWVLEVDSSCQAGRYAGSEADAQRIEIEAIDREGWQVQLLGNHRQLQRGEKFRFAFDARSDCDRPIAFGVRGSRPPFEIRGLHREVAIGSEWRAFVADFEVEEDSAESVPFFWLGQACGWVELRGARLERPVDGLVWQLEGNRPSAARLEGVVGDVEARVVRFLETTSDPWDVKLSGRGARVRAGEWFRLACRLTADSARRLLVGVCESESQWEPVGLLKSIEVDGSGQRLVLDFQGTADAERASVIFALGGAPESVVVSDVRLQPMDRADVVTIHAEDALVRTMAVTGDWTATRLELSASSDPWSVKCSWKAVPLLGGQAYRSTTRIRSDEDRWVLLGVGEATPPWGMLSPVQKVRTGRDWCEFVQDFVVPSDTASAWAFVCVGGSETAVELGGARIEIIANEEAWRLDAPDGQAYRVALPDVGSGARVEVLRASEEAWQIKLVGPTTAMELGHRYRFAARLRADRAREVVLGVSQAQPPWRDMGLFRRMSLTSEWQKFSGELAIVENASRAAFFIWLGADIGTVDVAGFRMEVEAIEGWVAPTVSATESSQVAAENGADADSSCEHQSGDGHVDEDSDDVNHARDKGSGTVSGIHSEPQKEEWELRPDKRAGGDDGDERKEDYRRDLGNGIGSGHEPDGQDAQDADEKSE